jgi:hypothetical protein
MRSSAIDTGTVTASGKLAPLPIVGENHQSTAKGSRRVLPMRAKNGGNPPFSKTGTPHANSHSSVDRPPNSLTRGMKMSFSNYARHAMAAVAAVLLTGFLAVNSLAVSAHEVHSVAGILA